MLILVVRAEIAHRYGSRNRAKSVCAGVNSVCDSSPTTLWAPSTIIFASSSRNTANIKEVYPVNIRRVRVLVGEETDSPAGRSRRNRLPRNRQRERVLQLVRAHGDAIDAVELASRMGLHVTTVRFHLDALCDEGAIERTRVKRDGAGRPRTGYRAVEERLDYRILAEILAMELGETVEARARRAQRAGVQWAGRIAGSQDDAVAAQDVPDTAEVGDP